MNTSKKIKLLDFNFKKNLGGNLFGVYKTTFIGSGMEFSEIRKYEHGEGVKNIDWKTTAKKGDLYIKKFEEERDLNILFALDISKSMDFGTGEINKKDVMQEILYALGMCVVENNDNIGAIIYDEKMQHFIYPQKGYANLYKIIEKMETIGSEKKDISKVFKEISKRQIKKSVIFILTDDMKIQEEKILKLAGKENQVIIFHIFDVFENNLFHINTHMTVSFGDDFLNINLNNEQKVEEYKKLRHQKLEDYKHILQKNNIGYLYLDTSSHVYKELQQYFYKLT